MLMSALFKRVIPVCAAVFLSPLLLTARSETSIQKLRAQIRSAPTLTYCDLLDNRDQYNGKLVRVRGIYKAGFENPDLSSPECDLGVLDSGITFAPEFEKLAARNWRNKLRRLDPQGLDVVFVGRFETSMNNGKRSFGHLDMYSYNLVVLTAENVQPLGKFNPLPGGSRDSLLEHLPPLPLCSAQLSDVEIHLSGTLSVLKETSLLWSEACPDAHSVTVSFNPNWRAATEPELAKMIDKMRRKSNTSWPYRGITAIQFNFTAADVVLEGVLIPNWRYVDGSSHPLFSPEGYERLFEVHRVISAKAKKPKK
jgi:hypothetical protein